MFEKATEQQIVTRLKACIDSQGMDAFVTNVYIANLVDELIWEFEPERRLFRAAFSQASNLIGDILTGSNTERELRLLALKRFLVDDCCLREDGVLFLIRCMKQLCEPDASEVASKMIVVQKRQLVKVGTIRGVGIADREVCLISGSSTRYVPGNRPWEPAGIVSLAGVPTDSLSVRYEYTGNEDKERTRQNPDKRYTLWKKWTRSDVGVLQDDGIITYHPNTNRPPECATLCDKALSLYAYATKHCGYLPV